MHDVTEPHRKIEVQFVIQPGAKGVHDVRDG